MRFASTAVPPCPKHRTLCFCGDRVLPCRDAFSRGGDLALRLQYHELTPFPRGSTVFAKERRSIFWMVPSHNRYQVWLICST
jgi:hypothetical protein